MMLQRRDADDRFALVALGCCVLLLDSGDPNFKRSLGESMETVGFASCGAGPEKHLFCAFPLVDDFGICLRWCFGVHLCSRCGVGVEQATPLVHIDPWGKDNFYCDVRFCVVQDQSGRSFCVGCVGCNDLATFGLVGWIHFYRVQCIQGCELDVAPLAVEKICRFLIFGRGRFAGFCGVARDFLYFFHIFCE